jgi:hypothetical protein
MKPTLKSAEIVIAHLKGLGFSEERLPLNDPVWRQTVRYLATHRIAVTFKSLDFGSRGEFQRAFAVDRKTGQSQLGTNGELIRSGTIVMDPRQLSEPLALLGLLVHETNHARRWISHGDRRWDFSPGETLASFEDFASLNQLNVAGCEALAHLRAAKFALRNRLPLSETEQQVLAIARQNKPLSQLVEELRMLVSRLPEYRSQHDSLLRYLHQAVAKELKASGRACPQMYSELTSAALMSFSRLRKMGIDPRSLTGRGTFARVLRWLAFQRFVVPLVSFPVVAAALCSTQRGSAHALMRDVVVLLGLGCLLTLWILVANAVIQRRPVRWCAHELRGFLTRGELSFSPRVARVMGWGLAVLVAKWGGVPLLRVWLGRDPWSSVGGGFGAALMGTAIGLCGGAIQAWRRSVGEGRPPASTT